MQSVNCVIVVLCFNIIPSSIGFWLIDVLVRIPFSGLRGYEWVLVLMGSFFWIIKCHFLGTWHWLHH
ncbi:hypothetical protein B0T17DRAFT_535431 [Bombardia bombarda]|uniref:Uncharacterized protein n=1 Tax=Bombardia bombarda TaxID=252184 RepID=A0AA39WUP5_9PEZI|nr:hypothetical protein B0T17DRAFT_535431 [Bombardia bombarda]